MISHIMYIYIDVLALHLYHFYTSPMIWTLSKRDYYDSKCMMVDFCLLCFWFYSEEIPCSTGYRTTHFKDYPFFHARSKGWSQSNPPTSTWSLGCLNCEVRASSITPKMKPMADTIQNTSRSRSLKYLFGANKGISIVHLKISSLSQRVSRDQATQGIRNSRNWVGAKHMALHAHFMTLTRLKDM